MTDFWAQDGFDIRLDWGQEGAARLAVSCPVVVVVDVLRFTTVVDVATARGVRVTPLPDPESTSDAISPTLAATVPAGTPLRIYSPNGGLACLAAASAGARVIAACFRNARAVGGSLQWRPIGFVAAGERWPNRALRPCWEDLCGAGAVIAGLDSGLSASPEAMAAAAAFRDCSRQNLGGQLEACISGRELREKDLLEDVRLAGELNRSDAVPVLDHGRSVFDRLSSVE